MFTRNQVRSLPALASMLFWLTATTAARAGGDTPGDAAVRARLEVATQREPYLVLDLEPARLRLMHGGAVLRDYPISAVEVGGASLMFVPRVPRVPALGQVWELERLDPARTFVRPEIRPPRAGEVEPPPAIPLEPEKALPAPPVFRLQFDPGLSIEVVGSDSQRPASGASPWRTVRWRLGELGQAMSPHPQVRLRLVLPAADAGALYRSLPIPVRLVLS